MKWRERMNQKYKCECGNWSLKKNIICVLKVSKLARNLVRKYSHSSIERLYKNVGLSGKIIVGTLHYMLRVFSKESSSFM